NIVKTAVRNDGMFGSVGKLIKISSNFTSQPKKKQAKSSPRSAGSAMDDPVKHERFDSDDDFDRPLKRKKITIKNDEPHPMYPDIFGNDEEEVTPVRESRPVREAKQADEDFDDNQGVRRKKISVKAPEEDVPALVKHMMSTDEDVPESAVPEPPAAEKPVLEPSGNGQQAAVSRKIRIVPEPPAEEASELEAVVDEAFLAEMLNVEADEPEQHDIEVVVEEILKAEVAELPVPEASVPSPSPLPDPDIPDMPEEEAQAPEVKPAESSVQEQTESQDLSASTPEIPLRKPDNSGNSASRKKFHVPGKHGRK
ncbi:MAG: hypothetical protein HGA62_08230, partial [Chlorobiaceae bacterium]|nr:hypothetical protein [Chlorobiaceae bacterium]